MPMIGVIGCLFAAAIQLFGVTGDSLRARAYFNANNVKVGDPLVLTVDFIGDGVNFDNLHPPALSRAVDRRFWKVDDASARTDTGRQTVGDFFSQREISVSRTLTYRVRPLREGVLWFPELEFEYEATSGGRRSVRTATVPVHAKPGTQVVVEGMEEDLEAMPEPPPLVTELGLDAPTGEGDLDWNWRRALVQAKADSFKDFDFTAGRLNEARCAILEGDWSRALRIYQRLEWRVGQTPEIERGLVAALARRYQNPSAELPVWRQVGRPILRYGWKGRVGLVFGGLVALVMVFWLLSKAIRAFACVPLVLGLCLFAAEARAQFPDPFAEMDARLRQMQQQMQGHFQLTLGGAGGLSVDEQKSVEIVTTVRTDRSELQVGDAFNFLLELETPKSCTLDNLQLQISESFGLTVLGQASGLTDRPSGNPTNVIRRLSVPVRYDVPFKGEVTFTVNGMVTGRSQRGRGGNLFNFSFSNSFTSRSNPVVLEVRPLADAGQPDDFSGIVAETVSLQQIPDSLSVETNDVIVLTYVLRHDGYLPSGYLPKGIAYEWERGRLPIGRREKLAVVWKAYFVADGAARTPELSISYYDPRSKTYKTVRAGGRDVRYR